ncbi:hypothetical protein SDC9_55367 [bioreactor metagenome]|uniref:Uncharacterized protein n=1 Tax=bioreactor metagenome TaxID=1076179 RepID=A0A644WZM2_9ZZZZ
MEQSIESVIVLKYKIFTKSKEEALSIVETFTCNRICKGECPEEFPSRIGTGPTTTMFYWPDNSLPFVYQIIDLNTIVDSLIPDEKFLSIFEEYIEKSLKKYYPDQNFDCIKELEILDHKIIERVKIIEER